jgi:putative endonuclease
MSEKQPAVYFMTNKKYGTIYTGVTSNLVKRIYEHKTSPVNSFTKKYNCKNLVYFEIHSNMYEAIKKEKRLKFYLRQWKIDLIEKDNSEWEDLYDKICS